MKNLHLIPTDKPTGIWKSVTDNLHFSIIDKVRTNPLEGFHIYITSDEEIKEGDWYLYFHQINKRIRKNSKAEYPYPNYKKIILTTDQDLDGVQAIDDEFLEWFVENPSCEEVEVQCRYNFYAGKDLTHYKIIIPKEEPKQETQGYICPQTKKQCDDECCVSAEDCHIEESINVLSEPKQETLEEAAERIYPTPNPYIMGIDLGNSMRREAFIQGTKWQQERMYSDEQMIEFGFSTYCYISELMGVPFNLISENKLHAMYNFEKFKKKQL